MKKKALANAKKVIVKECTVTKITSPKKYRLSDIIDEYYPKYVQSPLRQLYLEEHHWKAVNQIRLCQTSHLGVAHFECPSCKKRHYLYRSCKHRFCPRCGVSETNKWAEQTLSRLLKMKHHHIVMTLPKPFRNMSKLNGTLLLNILFKASHEVLKSWFKERHNQLPGIISVLHTSGSDLKYHPHVHMIVSAGGKNLETGLYEELSGEYLCSQRLLGLRLKMEFQRLLLKSYDSGNLKVYSGISNKRDLKSWLFNINHKHWIVSIQKPLEKLSEIVGYVGRYTKRCCLSEYKIESVCDGKISFRYNDYKNTPRGSKPLIGIKELSYVEFFDSLLMHVPYPRFRMVRYVGLYNSYHLKKIPSDLRGESLERLSEDTLEDLDRDWGDYEKFRKQRILSGKPDPLYCYDCEEDLLLVQLEYKKKSKLSYYDDS